MSNAASTEVKMAAIDDADAAVEHAHFADQPVMLGAAAGEDARFECRARDR